MDKAPLSGSILRTEFVLEDPPKGFHKPVIDDQSLNQNKKPHMIQGLVGLFLGSGLLGALGYGSRQVMRARFGGFCHARLVNVSCTGPAVPLRPVWLDRSVAPRKNGMLGGLGTSM